MSGGHELSDAFYQYGRNARWGTCVECPVDGAGRRLPELCAQTNRSDHRLNVADLADAVQRYGIEDQ